MQSPAHSNCRGAHQQTGSHAWPRLVFHAPEDGDDHAACGGQIRAKRRGRQAGHQPRVIDIRNIVIVPAAGRNICKRQAAAAEADINVCRTARHGEGIRAVAVFGEFEALAVFVRDRDALHSGVPTGRDSDRDLGARAGVGLVDLGDTVAAVRNLHREAGLGGLAAADERCCTFTVVKSVFGAIVWLPS